MIMLQIALSLFLFMKVNFLNFVAKLGNFLFASIWRMWAMSAMPLALGVLASATQTTFLPSGHFRILSSIRIKQSIFVSHSIFARRGFKTHYGPWSTGGDHQTHITAADLRAPFTTLGYDFHDQVRFQLRISIWHLNPGFRFPGCNWILHLRPACRSDVRHPLRARWP